MNRTISRIAGQDPVRIGIIGMGTIGAVHAENIIEGKVPEMRLAAICKGFGRLAPDSEIHVFGDSRELIRSGLVDAVLIASPSQSHADIGRDALEQGLHVLVEKPISVHKRDGEKLIAAQAGRSGQVFGAVFNQRTDPIYLKIRDLVHGGELGEIRRVNWIITNWFRTECYYARGSRATWAGQGGGILLNQCPHNLDLLQWIFGMPSSVHAFCRFGRYHEIEVEDDVTAFLQFPNGATGVFIASTGEAPGTNRLEITGERGRLVMENDRLHFTRNAVEMSDFSRIEQEAFAMPATSEEEILVSDRGGQHLGILRNFASAILNGEPLIAPAEEGIRSVELANAMLYSTFTGQTIELPLDGETYAAHWEKLIAQSP